MNRTIAISITLLLVATAVPTVEAGTREVTMSYLPGPYVTVISCSAEQHGYIPEETSPWLDNPEGWATSGEPECAGHDAVNTLRESGGDERIDGGYGGAAFEVIPSEFGGYATVTTDDDVFGVGSSYVWVMADSASEGTVTSDGCGPQGITIPEDMLYHDQGGSEDPYYIVWTWIDAAGVDPVTLAPCFASAGNAIATITAF